MRFLFDIILIVVTGEIVYDVLIISISDPSLPFPVFELDCGLDPMFDKRKS